MPILFENKLSSIERTVRNGNKPLQQVANRLIERYHVKVENVNKNTHINKNRLIKTYKYKNIVISGF